MAWVPYPAAQITLVSHVFLFYNVRRASDQCFELRTMYAGTSATDDRDIGPLIKLTSDLEPSRPDESVQSKGRDIGWIYYTIRYHQCILVTEQCSELRTMPVRTLATDHVGPCLRLVQAFFKNAISVSRRSNRRRPFLIE